MAALKNPNSIIEELTDDDEFSPRKEQALRNQLRDLYLQMQPYVSERDREIIRKIYANDKSDTPYSEEYNQLSAKHSAIRDKLYALLNGRADRTMNQFGRKKYENFTPHPNSIPVDPKNPGGTPEITGADRVYALYDYAMRKGLDFGKVLYDDRHYFPDRTPDVLEFSNQRFNLGKGHLGGDQWRKATPEDLENYKKNGDRFGEIKDGWKHISAGTNYGSDISDLLAKENFK